MADNVIVSNSATFTAATDDIGSIHYPYVKLVDGTLDSSTKVVYDANRGFIVQPNKLTRISLTPTISTSAYTAGDAVGGLLTFANAARFSGGGIRINSVVIVDKDQELAPFDLVLFDRTFTATADNAVFAPSDADLANCIAVIPILSYANFSTNAVAYSTGPEVAAVLNGTSLFGQLVVRGSGNGPQSTSAPTYTATTDIIVTVNLVQE